MVNRQEHPTTEKTVTARINAMPVGTIIPFAGNAETAADLSGLGWFLCNGAMLGRNDFPHLFSVLQNSCGGDFPNFRIPDLRGVFLRGVDLPTEKPGTHRDPDAGERTSHTSDEVKAPNKVLSRQADAFENHRHNIPNGPVYVDNVVVSASPVDQTPPTIHMQRFDKPGEGIITPTLDAGTGDTRPVNVSVNYIIFAGLPLNNQKSGIAAGASSTDNAYKTIKYE
jgi:microcystin-dependent protein